MSTRCTIRVIYGACRSVFISRRALKNTRHLPANCFVRRAKKRVRSRDLFKRVRNAAVIGRYRDVRIVDPAKT